MNKEPRRLTTGRPVPNLAIEFQWHEGTWKDLFDKHVQFIQQDILRSLAGNKLVVYLSCPISSRGGSFFATNVEIADFTVRRLSQEWGSRFWFLNPAQYQMESHQGLGLIRMHAYELGLETKTTIDLGGLMNSVPTVGGDYMRMWTRVLAEDGGEKLGGRFSAFYFLSPSDVKAFFLQSGAKNLTAGVESYFASKFATDSQFYDYFSLPLKDEKGVTSGDPPEVQAVTLADRKREFFRYYAIKASAYFSKGSHDEWNIWQKLNAMRMAGDEKDYLGLGSQIPGYYEGLQVDPGAAEMPISPGYAMPQAVPTVVRQTASMTHAVEQLAQHSLRKEPNAISNKVSAKKRK